MSSAAGKPLRDAMRSFFADVGPQRARQALDQLDDLATEDRREGQVLGDFVLGRRIGHGGMGVVYHAEQQSVPGRAAAIKILYEGSAQRMKRIVREVDVIGRLDHPHLVPILSADLGASPPWFAMPFVAGRTLHEVLEQDTVTTRDIATFVTWIRDIATGLEHAHRHGIVHRDVNPRNVMINADEHALLLDFGLAFDAQSEQALTMSTDQLGTLEYMAPEQISSKHGAVSPRTDVYGLGVTLFRYLAGSVPYRAPTWHETQSLILHGAPPVSALQRGGAASDLRIVCLKALERKPDDRYASARELADDLEAILHHRPIRARAPSASRRARQWLRRHSVLALVGAVVAAVIVTMIGWFSWWLPLQQLESHLREAELLWGKRNECLTATTSGQTANWASLAALLQAKVGVPLDANDPDRITDATDARIQQQLQESLRIDSQHESARRDYSDFAAYKLEQHLRNLDFVVAPEHVEFWEQEIRRYDDEDRYADLLMRETRFDIDCAGGRAEVLLCPAETVNGVTTYLGDTMNVTGRVSRGTPKQLGTTPIRDASIQEGSYLLRFVRDGYRETRLPLVVRRPSISTFEERVVNVQLFTDEEIGDGFRYIPPGYGVVGPLRRGSADMSDRLRRIDEGFFISELELTWQLLGKLTGMQPGEALIDWQTRLESGVKDSDISYQLTLPNNRLEPIHDLNFIRIKTILEMLWVREPGTDVHYAIATPQQWQWAARGADGRRFPWGNADRPSWALTFRQRRGQTTPGLHLPPQDISPFLVRNMAGFLTEVSHSADVDADQSFLRFPSLGGSYVSGTPEEIELHRLDWRSWDERHGELGFRLVKRIVTPPPPTCPTELHETFDTFQTRRGGWQCSLWDFARSKNDDRVTAEQGELVMRGYEGAFSPALRIWHPVRLPSNFRMQLRFRFQCETRSNDFARVMAFGFGRTVMRSERNPHFALHQARYNKGRYYWELCLERRGLNHARKSQSIFRDEADLRGMNLELSAEFRDGSLHATLRAADSNQTLIDWTRDYAPFEPIEYFALECGNNVGVMLHVDELRVSGIEPR